MSARLQAGDVVDGKFVVERVIGTGGMGQVLRARHRELGTVVAIKVILPGAEIDEDAVLRFKREARAMGTLRSEHSVRVYDVGETEGGLPYMIMEHLEGSDLSAVLRKQGPLPVETALEYLAQTCEALVEAHDAGIVHRDLKPQNLFLSRRSSGEPHVRVLDFGLAKPFTEVKVDLKVTRQGDVVGTTHYMAPEQLRGLSVDGRADIWSAGVCLFRLLTGKYPFGGSSPSATVAKILSERATPIRDVRADVPASVAALIDRCLQKSPDARFPHMRALRIALRDALAEIRAEPPRPPRQRPRDVGTVALEERTIAQVRWDAAAAAPRPSAPSMVSIPSAASAPSAASVGYPQGVVAAPSVVPSRLPSVVSAPSFTSSAVPRSNAGLVVAMVLGVMLMFAVAGGLLIAQARRPSLASAQPPPSAPTAAAPPTAALDPSAAVAVASPSASAAAPIELAAPPSPSIRPPGSPGQTVPSESARPARTKPDAGLTKKPDPYDHL